MLPMGFAAMPGNKPKPEIMLAIVPTRCWDGVVFALLFRQAKSGGANVSSHCIIYIFTPILYHLFLSKT